MNKLKEDLKTIAGALTGKGSMAEMSIYSEGFATFDLTANGGGTYLLTKISKHDWQKELADDLRRQENIGYDYSKKSRLDNKTGSRNDRG